MSSANLRTLVLLSLSSSASFALTFTVTLAVASWNGFGRAVGKPESPPSVDVKGVSPDACRAPPALGSVVGWASVNENGVTNSSGAALCAEPREPRQQQDW